MRKVLIAYVPVLHRGYRHFFERHADARELYLIGPDLTLEYRYLAKEIRELPAEEMKQAVEALGLFDVVSIADEVSLRRLREAGDVACVFPDEDVSKRVAEKHLDRKPVIYDSVFLRWDKHNTVKQSEPNADHVLSADEFDREMIQKTRELGAAASDWWRQIGCVVVKDGEVLISTRNHHVPSDHTPYVHGDPRNAWHKGVHVDLSSVLHAEAGAVAEAARRGISLEGASMYVTTFPCPPCAKQIAYAGIKKLYYSDGYKVLDGEDVLRSQGVEIIRVTEE